MKQYLFRWSLAITLLATIAACMLPLPLRSEAVYAPAWAHQSIPQKPSKHTPSKSQPIHHHSPHKGERSVGILFLITMGIGFWASLFFMVIFVNIFLRFGITFSAGLIFGILFGIIVITALSILYAIYYINNSYYVYAADKQVSWARKLKHIILGWVLTALYIGVAIAFLWSPWTIMSALFAILAIILMVVGILSFRKNRPSPATDNSGYPQPK